MRKIFTSVALTLVTLSSFAVNVSVDSLKNCNARYTINYYDQSGHYLGSSVGIADAPTCEQALSIAKDLAVNNPL